MYTSRPGWVTCAAIYCLTAILSRPLIAEDWAKVEEAYKAARDQYIKQGPPAYYVTGTNDSLRIWDSRPEFGMGIHNPTRAALDTLGKANVRFLRCTMYWNAIENGVTPGQYNETALQEWDARLALLEQHGMIPLIVVHGNPPGASFTNRVDSYVRFAQFMEMVVKRYPNVCYWELFNEMDSSFTDLFGAGIVPEVPMYQRGRYYADMLVIVSPVIRKANPSAVIVHGGLTDVGEFVRGVYEGGGRIHFDVMNLHTYGVPLVWSFVERGIALRRIMQEQGDGAKPLWNTEFGIDAAAVVRAWGMPTNNAAVCFDDTQAAAILDCLEFNRASGLYQKCFAYQYVAANEVVPEGLKNATGWLPVGMTLDDFGFGFMRRDGITPRPVFTKIVADNINDPAVLIPTQHRDVTWNEQTLSVETRSDFPAMPLR